MGHSRSGLAAARLCTLLVAGGLALASTQVTHARADGEPDNDLVGRAGVSPPSLALHGFTDVLFGSTAMRQDTGPTRRGAAFALGQLDLFLVSHLAPNLSFLSEVVIEGDERGESKAEVERVFIKYAWSDFLRVSAGRTHTALGYWNEAYHHGALLQPTVERPVALRFEDDGGVLPVHAAGLEASGTVNLGSFHLEYVGNVANGRGPHRGLVQTGGDANTDKAVALKISAVRDGAWRFVGGPMLYRDRIPADASTPGRASSIGETIFGGHAAVLGERCELFGEFFQLDHRDLDSRMRVTHRGWYALATADLSPRLRPYALLDRMDFGDGDAYFADDDRDVTTVTAGLRYSVHATNAIKLEYRHTTREKEVADGVFAQTAYSF